MKKLKVDSDRITHHNHLHIIFFKASTCNDDVHELSLYATWNGNGYCARSIKSPLISCTKKCTMYIHVMERMRL